MFRFQAAENIAIECVKHSGAVNDEILLACIVNPVHQLLEKFHMILIKCAM